jgi:hypothetical protein
VAPMVFWYNKELCRKAGVDLQNFDTIASRIRCKRDR